MMMVLLLWFLMPAVGSVVRKVFFLLRWNETMIQKYIAASKTFPFRFELETNDAECETFCENILKWDKVCSWIHTERETRTKKTPITWFYIHIQLNYVVQFCAAAKCFIWTECNVWHEKNITHTPKREGERNADLSREKAGVRKRVHIKWGWKWVRKALKKRQVKWTIQNTQVFYIW